MASFNWLPWNQIVLFDEQSRGDTCERICRRGTFLLWGSVSCRWWGLLEKGGPESRPRGIEGFSIDERGGASFPVLERRVPERELGRVF